MDIQNGSDLQQDGADFTNNQDPREEPEIDSQGFQIRIDKIIEICNLEIQFNPEAPFNSEVLFKKQKSAARGRIWRDHQNLKGQNPKP